MKGSYVSEKQGKKLYNLCLSLEPVPRFKLFPHLSTFLHMLFRFYEIVWDDNFSETMLHCPFLSSNTLGRQVVINNLNVCIMAYNSNVGLYTETIHLTAFSM